MKKFFAAILTVFLSLGLLTACGGGQQHGASSAPAVKALKDQIQEVQINQKAASGRIKSTRIPMLFRAVKMLTKGARTKEKISRQSYNRLHVSFPKR